jgi:O-antigen biosynthesis protein
MEPPPVSVVVASLGRPRELDRCLAGLRQLTYRPHEVVVVACAEGRAAIGRHLGAPWLRVIPNRGTGVAAARNDGVAAAAGDIVAFLDDDAVPEPLWLDHLVAAMEAMGAPAATGYVRGRNGISFQWRGRAIRRDGFIETLPDAGEAAYVPPPEAGIPMIEGTNMAFRRDLLGKMGGFDPAYRFYLDDADMAVRLADACCRAAIVPLAQVHHGFAASSRRRQDRMPTDLFDVGRSLVLYLRAHLGEAGAAPALALHREGERRRLLRYMVTGHAAPGDVAALLARFDEGARDALRTEPATSREIPPPLAGACFRTAPPGPARVIAGRPWARDILRRRAAEAAAAGEIVSLFRFGPTALHHRVRFDPAGFWEQTGGLFGRAERTEPLFRLQSFPLRLAREVGRVAKVRAMPETAT